MSLMALKQWVRSFVSTDEPVLIKKTTKKGTRSSCKKSRNTLRKRKISNDSRRRNRRK